VSGCLAAQSCWVWRGEVLIVRCQLSGFVVCGFSAQEKLAGSQVCTPPCAAAAVLNARRPPVVCNVNYGAVVSLWQMLPFLRTPASSLA